MSYVVLEEQYLNDIATHIRNKNGATTTYKPREMADAIRALSALPSRSDVEDAFLSGSITNFTYTHIPTIGEYAFYNDSGLRKVDSTGVINAYSYCFANCENLREVNLPELVDVGIGVFANCENLTTVNLPKIKNFADKVFSGCIYLSSVNLPSLEGLASSCFEDCVFMQRIVLPSLKDYMDNTFNGCDSLRTVILPNPEKVVFHHYETYFEDTSPNPIKDGTCKIYVPAALISQYKNDTNGWTKYYSPNVFLAIEDYPGVLL